MYQEDAIPEGELVLCCCALRALERLRSPPGGRAQPPPLRLEAFSTGSRSPRTLTQTLFPRVHFLPHRTPVSFCLGVCLRRKKGGILSKRWCIGLGHSVEIHPIFTKQPISVRCCRQHGQVCMEGRHGIWSWEVSNWSSSCVTLISSCALTEPQVLYL